MNLNENVGGIIMKSRKMMHHNEHSNNRMIMGTNITKQRLESLDVLRGFDLFCLVALEGIMHPLAHAIDAPWFDYFMWNFTHMDWEGLSPWDLVMPLFMFMSGVSIPFALSRYRKEAVKGQAYRRILKRVILLWIFGMMCQGNLLALNPERIYLYTNTLQSIAVGYLVASLLFLNTRVKTQIGIAAGLLFTFWGCMEFISVDGYGYGNYTPDGNLAEWIDRTLLGRFRDAATVQDGQVVFAPWYRYTWILSSLNFAVTTLTGLVCRIYPERQNTTIGTKVLSIGGYWCVISCRRMVMELSDAGHQETVDQFHGASNQRMVLFANGCILLDYRPQRLV